jgi:hypothetical protein
VLERQPEWRAAGQIARELRLARSLLRAQKKAMKQLQHGVWLLGLLGLVACGGRAIDDSGTGGSEPSEPGPANTPNGSAGKPGSSSSSGSLPSHELGECKPGFSHAEQPARACHWLTEAGVCFDDIDDACSCICPNNRASVCFSPFDNGPNSATRVYCE